MNVFSARLSPASPAPLDIRLMNMTAALLWAAVVLAALGSAVWWLLSNPHFAIERIVVHGQTHHTSAANLESRVLPNLKGNFFTLSMAQTKAAFEAAPWIERAVVWRQWPRGLEVTLEEHVPLAHWGPDSHLMIDVNGQMFDTGSPGRWADTLSLPTFIGPQGQAASVLAMYNKLNPIVSPLGAHLASLELQDRGSWRARLSGQQFTPPNNSPSMNSNAPLTAGTNGAMALSAEVALGSGTADELAARLHGFITTAPQIASHHQRSISDIESADLSYTNGYALHLKGVATSAAPATPAANADQTKTQGTHTRAAKPKRR